MSDRQILNDVSTEEVLKQFLETADRILQLVDINPCARAQMLEEFRVQELSWLEQKFHRQNEEYCPYCDGAEALVIGDTNDKGIAIKRNAGNTGCSLMAYGYDVIGSGTNGLITKINYCPICGKWLNEVESQ